VVRAAAAGGGGLKIADSIHRREPCKRSAPKAGPEVLDALDALDALEATHLWGRGWSGSMWKSPRLVLVSLVKIAREHGKTAPDGVRVSASIRQLALAAGLGGKTTTLKAINRLVERGILRRETATKRGVSGVLVLIAAPHQKGNDSSQVHPSTSSFFPIGVPTLSRGEYTEGEAVDPAVSTHRASLTAERLRWSAPVYENGKRVGTVRRLGKTAEEVVDALEAAGRPLTLSELADVMRIKRRWNLTQGGEGPVPRLERRGVVKVEGDTVSLRLSLDWLNILNRARVLDGELDARDRQERRYAEDTRRYREFIEVQNWTAPG
jgi:hypothetical protein